MRACPNCDEPRDFTEPQTHLQWACQCCGSWNDRRSYEIVETTHGFEILENGNSVLGATWTTRELAERDVARMQRHTR